MGAVCLVEPGSCKPPINGKAAAAIAYLLGDQPAPEPEEVEPEQPVWSRS